MEKYDVIVIGSGPAGLTAALYTTRAELNTLVIAGQSPGGQLMWTTDVENYPGFPKGILGPELIQRMRQQATRFNAVVKDENAVKLEVRANKDFLVTTNDNNYQAASIIVAAGASAKWLGLDSEERLKGKGVSACATCDGFFFKNKVVAVVGGGDAAMEEATFLTKYANKVYTLVRKSKEQMKASKIMQERAFGNDKIELVFNTEVKEVLGKEKVIGLKIVNSQTQKKSELEVDGLFVAIGHQPNTGFLKDIIELDHKGYIIVKDNTLSSQAGIFVAGDVADYRYRQAVTAAGSGCMAALDAIKYLSV